MKWLSVFVKKLPLWGQLALFLPVQGAWLVALVAVQLKARANARVGLYFASEHLVYTLVLLWMPLVLFIAGLLVWLRHGPNQARRVERVSYRVFAWLTSLNALVIVLCGLWALTLGDIRE
jgi:cytochrome b subunit of formate dehydrogenase